MLYFRAPRVRFETNLCEHAVYTWRAKVGDARDEEPQGQREYHRRDELRVGVADRPDHREQGAYAQRDRDVC